MNLWRLAFGCSQFRRLTLERFDRKLSASEEAFVDEHRESCTPCYHYELHGLNAMNLLRAGSVEAEAGEDFDARVLRTYRLERRESARQIWGPFVAGAAAAGLALLAALQIISQSTRGLPNANPAGAEAQLRVERADASSPDLIIRSDERQ